MKNILHTIPFKVGGAVMALALLFGLGVFVDGVFAADTEVTGSDRLVTIHDQGLEQTIVTKATTVCG